MLILKIKIVFDKSSFKIIFTTSININNKNIMIIHK